MKSLTSDNRLIFFFLGRLRSASIEKAGLEPGGGLNLDLVKLEVALFLGFGLVMPLLGFLGAIGFVVTVISPGLFVGLVTLVLELEGFFFTLSTAPTSWSTEKAGDTYGVEGLFEGFGLPPVPHSSFVVDGCVEMPGGPFVVASIFSFLRKSSPLSQLCLLFSCFHCLTCSSSLRFICWMSIACCKHLT